MKIKRLRPDVDVTATPVEEETPVTEFNPGTDAAPVEPSEESAFLASMRRLFAEMQNEAEVGDVIDVASDATPESGVE